ncbi:hypothetical protein O1611_g7963 [Lasiodiplodia mahajangana]|uniref:Uncharacterized protein n=1 Tax=Lasiodiplodia mahajangana TaxID=1108764 RepID=A0ACC2JDS3_9PEZI|nr:hypothetical protein O1611_g7963 [Lasiodiplodia mahajangana]
MPLTTQTIHSTPQTSIPKHRTVAPQREAMSYYIHPHVKTLKFIADNWERDRHLNSSDSSSTNTPHDAQALARLVSNASWAVQDPYSEAVAHFVKWYRKAQEIDLKSMKTAKLEDELKNFQADIDDMFFFSLLTRKPPGAERRFVPLIVNDDKTNKEGLCGRFESTPKAQSITLWRYDSKGKAWHIEHLIHALVHEMCHAYLAIFSDRRHRKHDRWYKDFDGHGEMFWVLVRFISGKILSYTNSDRWRTELGREEDRCYAMTGKKCEPGSWGSPERILMGGDLPS